MEEWFKIKGYYHLTAQTSRLDYSKLVQKIKNRNYISKYSFYPLLHIAISSRRYKKVNDKRFHSYFDSKSNSTKKTVKIRPLHYATHIDSLIFSYYGSLLNTNYNKLIKNTIIDEVVTAYRKIPVDVNDPNSKNKSSIHFAKEVFDEILKRNESLGECVVLTFDIESFFSSLDHQLLKKYWKQLIGVNELPPDHKNVFNAATKYSFIYKNDLKIQNSRHFDEKTIGRNRTRSGVKSFFASPKEFREQVKRGKLRVYKNKESLGIPQGLPISAILANLYLLEFDQLICDKLVEQLGCYYRRYSDDIAIICNKDNYNEVEDFIIESIKNFKLVINRDKTEKFHFKKENGIVKSYQILNNSLKTNKALTYLGFEYYGHKTLIKSANLSKFYRRMIYAVKSKSKRAIKISENTDTKPILFINQIRKLYSSENLDKQYKIRNFYILKQKENGTYKLVSSKRKSKSGSYFKYVEKASEILNSPEIMKQLKGKKRVLNQSLKKHFFDKINNEY